MSKRTGEQDTTNSKSKKRKKERPVNEAKTEIVSKMIEQIKEILEDPLEEKDYTDGLGDAIKEVFQPILDKFKNLIKENEDTKSFNGGLVKIFTILLSCRASSLTKIKK